VAELVEKNTAEERERKRDPGERGVELPRGLPVPEAEEHQKQQEREVHEHVDAQDFSDAE
jgi:hypothetical protein